MAMFGLFKKKEKPAAEKPAQETGGALTHILNEKYGPFTGETVELNAITGATITASAPGTAAHTGMPRWLC